ncbi:MAG: protein BatD [Proteobacteria bacterium]|nr:protein BatD [Pseudomonadota bacterium]NOG59649.1 protein BatD [Pseudomonadota bacterium]
MNLKIIITFVFLLFSHLLQAEISVSVDRNPVVADESFKLIFESDQKVKSDPDFSPLNKSFTVLSTGRRSNTQIINRDIKQTHQWILTVITNKTGIVEIPAIRFGKESSKPTQIKVVTSAVPKAGNTTDDIFIEVETNTENPYVQAQIIYTVKLYRAVQTNNATLSEPEISGGQAVINKLGDDKSFETRLKGKRYVVIQRQYAIFPQNSGSLVIEPLIFQGQTGSGNFFSFDPFGPQPKSIVKRSDSIQLDVKPIPDSFTGNTWLPARHLSIQEQWSTAPDKLKQGEATTRILTLTANGLAASNLPTIESSLTEKLKQYPDQPEFEESNNENGYVGVRREKMAIIPTEAGDYVLPAIKIPWWNTETDKLEMAELPERTIHVDISATMPAPTAPVNNIQQQNETASSGIEEKEPDEKEPDEKVINVSEPLADQTPWKWISLVFFIMWLLTLLMLWRSKKKSVIKNKQNSSDLTGRHYLKQLKQACVSDNPTETKKSLLDWARNKWPDENINSINSIKLLCDENLKIKIDELNACLYGKTGNQWNGTAFLKTFESQKFDKKTTKEEKGNLEPLYKT